MIYKIYSKVYSTSIASTHPEVKTFEVDGDGLKYK